MGLLPWNYPGRRGSGASGNTGGGLGGDGGVIKRAHLSGLCGFFSGITH